MSLRYEKNPVIPRICCRVQQIFNSAVVPYNGEFAGVFRCDNTARVMQIHSGRSKDGINWEIDPDRIQMISDDPEIGKFEYAYDPRVCWIDDRYYVTWCNGYHGPTIGIAWTKDFREYHQMENAYLPFNRNGVMFPRKLNGKYVMLTASGSRHPLR
jgi:beta-1,4-mannooligosaccharide/beta-1,4-mannosyl-N-acetylglucosamine phosphorylase